MSAKLFRVFDTTGFGTGHLRAADLNGDGLPELLVTQNYPMNREVSCMTVMDLDGNILWRNGEPMDNGSHVYSDIPIQVYDWDGDGKIEVLYIKQAFYKKAVMWQYSTARSIIKEIHHYDEVRLDPDLATEQAAEFEGTAQLVVLDGATGQTKQVYDIPPASDDCLAIGYFDGTGKANVIVKDRYWNMYALNHEGKILWSLDYTKLGKHLNLGHFPAVGDIDGDGLDEVFITNTLIDSDGTVLWQIPDAMGHSDTALILDDIEERRIITCADKVRCIAPDGTVLWSYDAGHQQNVTPGKFSSDPKHGPYQFITRDITPEYPDYITAGQNGHAKHHPGQLVRFIDWYGNIIRTAWEENSVGDGNYRYIRWTGKGDSILHYHSDPDENGFYPCDITDFEGHVLDTVYFADLNGQPEPGIDADKVFMLPINLIGDLRDELVLFNGNRICIYTNTAPYLERRHYNYTHYVG